MQRFDVCLKEKEKEGENDVSVHGGWRVCPLCEGKGAIAVGHHTPSGPRVIICPVTQCVAGMRQPYASLLKRLKSNGDDCS